MPKPALAPSRRQISPTGGRRPLLEPIWWPIYDANTIAAAASGDVDFFRDPTGTNSKTLVDTNMEKARSLASPKLYYVFGIGAFADPNIAGPADPGDDEHSSIHGKQELAYLTAFEFSIGEKIYIDVPVVRMPSNYRLSGFVHYANDGAVNGSELVHAALVGKPYLITKHVLRIFPEQLFSGVLRINDTLALDAATKLWICLWGELHREVM